MIPESDIPSDLSRLVDNCKKLGLVFENVVGIVEIINSKAVQLQVRINSSIRFKTVVPGGCG